MKQLKAWLVSFRLRTLPLALSSTGMGSFLASGYHAFRWNIFILTSLTAILLQVLSNLANEYGDMVHGADTADRKGPVRSLQSGAISMPAMRRAIILCSIILLTCGLWLLKEGTAGLPINVFIGFLLLGLLCMAAAIRYTVGKNPYGYAGLGDISVFIFFGLTGVAGTFYLHAHFLPPSIFLPAIAIGFLSAGVLNVNNMRDIDSDRKAGKRTLPVRWGLKNAKRYHFILILSALMALFIFSMSNYSSAFQFLYLIMIPLFMIHIVSIFARESVKLDNNLRQLALFTLLLVVCFGINFIYCAASNL